MASRQERLEQVKALWANVTWADMATFIGPRAEGYRAIWDKTSPGMAAKGYAGFNLSWCWPAFIPISGIPWALARKQWAFAATMVVIVLVLNILSTVIPSTSLGFMPFLAACIAKPFYLQTAVAKIAKIKAQFPEGPERDAAISAAGGVNMTAGYVAGAVCFGIIGLIVASLVMGEMG